MEVRTHSTGFVQEINGFKDRIPEFDPRTGDHLWILINMFKLACYFCERPFTSQLAMRRCKGNP